jgi:hypothetical protein
VTHDHVVSATLADSDVATITAMLTIFVTIAIAVSPNFNPNLRQFQIVGPRRRSAANRRDRGQSSGRGYNERKFPHGILLMFTHRGNAPDRTSFQLSKTRRRFFSMMTQKHQVVRSETCALVQAQAERRHPAS